MPRLLYFRRAVYKGENSLSNEGREESFAGSPDFQFDLTISINQLKICPIRGDEAGAAGACSEGNENVKVQVTQFVRLKALIVTNVCQYLARLQPVLLGRSEDRVVPCHRAQKLVFPRPAYTAP